MAGDDNFRVDNVSHEKEIKKHEEVVRPEERKHKQEGHQREKRRSKDYFATLARRAEVTNQEMARKGLPYKFCVYEEGDEVYIDVVTLDAKGQVVKTVRRNITDEDFDRWIDDMSSLEGLFLDTNA